MSLQDLDSKFAIVDPETGKPSQYFLRLIKGHKDTSLSLEESVDAILGTQVVAGAGLTGGGAIGDGDITVDVGAGTGITVNANDVAIDTVSEAERIRDIIGAALVAGANITITVSDPGDTITIATTGTVPATRNLTAGAGLTGGGDLAADRTFNVGAGVGITVNADDVAIDTTAEAERARDTIGTALVAGTDIGITVNDGADTITVAVDSTTIAERIRDTIGSALVAGTNITITVNDGADTITIAEDTSASAEFIRDTIGTALVAGSGITITVNDAGDTITIAASALGSTFHGALVNKSTDETTADYSTIRAVAWPAETTDTDAFHDNSTNNSRLTIPSGVSRVTVWGCVAASAVAASAPCFLQIRKNGSNAYIGAGLQFGISRADGSGLQMQVATAPGIAVTAGDYFELFFSTIGDSSITVAAANSSFGLEVVA